MLWGVCPILFLATSFTLCFITLLIFLAELRFAFNKIENILISALNNQTDLTKDNFLYFLLLDKIADDLELNEDISQNYDCDQIDDFIEIVREIGKHREHF